MSAPTCSCACHDGLYAACDVEGGCGSVGCDYGADFEASERRCARGEHCADREPVRDDDGRHTGTWLPRRITVERGVCGYCTHQVRHGLSQLTGHVVQLTAQLGQRGGAAQTLVASTRDLSVPISLTFDALRTEIDEELQAWVEPVAEVLGVEWDTAAMGRARQLFRVQRAADLLYNAVEVLLALPPLEHPAWENGEPKEDPDEPGVQATIVRDGVDGALALFDLHRRARAILGLTEYMARVAMPCTRCGWKALVRHNGEDFVICENCRHRTPREEIPFFCRVLIDCERALEEERERQGAPA